MRSARASIAVVAIACVAGLTTLSTAAAGLPAAAARFTAGNSGLDGGGFVAVLGMSPEGQTLVAGGDSQGLFWSSSTTPGGFGRNWMPANARLAARWSRKIAAVLPLGSRRWLAAAGNGTTGGLLVSTDDGRSWTATAHSSTTGSPPVFQAGNLVPNGPDHPRATGHLLARVGTGAGSEIFAASLTGLSRWTGDPALADLTGSWSATLGTATGLVALAVEPTTITTPLGIGLRMVYVADDIGHVHRIALRGGTLVEDRDFSAGINPPRDAPPGGVQELFLFASHLYAAGLQGLSVCDNCATATSTGRWTTLLTTPDTPTVAPGRTTFPTAPLYTVSAAAAGGGAETVRVGASDAVKVTAADVGTFGVGALTVTWPTAGAAPAPTAPVNETNFSPSAVGGWDLWGLPGTRWWLAEPSGAPSMAVGGDTYVASDLLTTPDGALWVAGRSGVWRKAAGGSGPASWSPAVHGLGTTFDKAVAIKPGDPTRIGVADTDWAFVGSTDSLGTVTRNVTGKPAKGPFSGFALIWSPVAGAAGVARALLTTGDRDCNTAGAVWRSDGPVAGDAWVALPDPPARARVLAVTADSAGLPLFAAVQDGNPGPANCNTNVPAGTGGVYRYSTVAGTPAWTRTAGPRIGSTDIHAAAFAADGGNTVYLYERQAGTTPGSVWRSVRTGTAWGTWQRIVALAPADDEGAVLVDPAVPTRLWISTRQGLRYLTSASTCGAVGTAGACAPSVPAPGTAPGGALGAAPGDTSVFMARPAVSEASPAALLEVIPSATPGALPAVVDRADAYYRDSVLDPESVAVSVVGGLRKVYVTAAGNGVTVARQ